MVRGIFKEENAAKEADVDFADARFAHAVSCLFRILKRTWRLSAVKNSSVFFSFSLKIRNDQKRELLPVSPLPDIVGTLVPTITVSFIDAISTLRIAKNPTLTHKDANKPIYSSLAYQVCPTNKNACYS